MTEIDRKKQQIISYLTLRTLIGLLGVILPILLVVACFLYGGCTGFKDSISSYYHSGVRDLFVGVLFVLGFFLLTYKGYEALDNIVASCGFVFALGVALFPSQNPSAVIRALHFVSAGLLFSVFIYFSLCLFTKGAKKGERTKQKNRRNTVYIVCGVMMTVFIVCIAASMIFLSPAQLSAYNPVFWFETLALWAFGVSWLTKGQVFWRDAKGDG